MKIYSRETMAEIWIAGLSDRERRILVEQFQEQHGGDAMPEPTALELFREFNAGTITLEAKNPSGTPQDDAGVAFGDGRG